jgi:hypothetical protein
VLAGGLGNLHGRSATTSAKYDPWLGPITSNGSIVQSLRRLHEIISIHFFSSLTLYCEFGFTSRTSDQSRVVRSLFNHDQILTILRH